LFLLPFGISMIASYAAMNYSSSFLNELQ
jgi:hypothetical protein